MYKKFGKIAACILCISILLTSAVFAKNFKDVNDWSTEAVDRVSDYRLMVGVGGGYFAPGATITQKEVASVLYRLAKKPNWYQRPDYVFADAPVENIWYRDAILWAGYHDIINVDHQDQGLYLQPDREILRLEAVSVLYNLALYSEWIEPYSGEWKDNTELEGAANELKQAAAWALANKIWFGHDNGTFMPFETITRAEFAAMVSRFMDRFEAELSSQHGVYTTEINMASVGDCVITNAEGETLIYKDDKFSGTMKFTELQFFTGSPVPYRFYVKPSAYFTCTALADGEIKDFSVYSESDGEGNYGTAHNLEGVKEVVLKNDRTIEITGENMQYRLFHSADMEVEGYYVGGFVAMTGEGETKASFTYDKQNSLYYAKCDTGRFSIAVSDSDELDRKDFTDQTEEVCVSVNRRYGTIEIENANEEAA